MMTNVEELRRLQILNDYIAQSIEAAHRIARCCRPAACGTRRSRHSDLDRAAPWARSPFVGQVPFAGTVPFGPGVPSPLGATGVGAGLYHTTARASSIR
jgi:hypothetical protein